MATFDQAVDQMYDAGMPEFPGGRPVVDGKRHRYGRKNRAYYLLHNYTARNGREYIAGYFGLWGVIELTKVRADYTGMESDERQRLQRAHAAREVQEREKKVNLQRFAAGRARGQWNAARARLKEGEACEYLARKGLGWTNGLRLALDGTLLVPMVRYDVKEEQEQDPGYTGPLRLCGLQKIAPDGEKRFSKGMLKEGTAFRAGPKPKDGELILVGEGLATVLSVVQALENKMPAFVAFDAGNLVPVAKILRALYPKSPLLFLADDDAYLEAQFNGRLRDNFGVAGALFRAVDVDKVFPTKNGAVTAHGSIQEDPKGTPVLVGAIEADGKVRPQIVRNAGRTKAWEAADVVGLSFVCWPKFADREVSPDPDKPKLTDFNDLHKAEGIDVMRGQVADEVTRVRDSVELARSLAEGRPPRDGEAVLGGGGGKDEPPEVDWAAHNRMLGRFTLIYTTDFAFDAEIGTLVRIPTMNRMFGGKMVAMWLASNRKRWVLPRDVVFDPALQSDTRHTVNLFRGLEVKPPPEGAKCDRLLELLHRLCGEDPEDTHAPFTSWILRWCAYPLQHMGTKMATAVVMHGEEGTGKNLFFGALRSIYGVYSVVITQMELEEKHNTWMSAKLFVIANEVVTRSEMSHQMGRLKHIVTEPEIYINPKFVDPRYERNYMQMVFLSNELQPLRIGPRDRRYFVVKTPDKIDPELHKAVVAELAAGGAEALYAHLMALDLVDFNAHTKPLVTDAKTAVIEQGMMPSQLFWKDIYEGRLGVPYVPALSTDVYHLYVVWCARNGHKMPEALTKFSPNFMSLNGVRRVDRRVPRPGHADDLILVSQGKEDELRMHRIFLMGTPAATPALERQRISDGVREFRKKARAWISEYDGWTPAAKEGDNDGARQQAAF